MSIAVPILRLPHGAGLPLPARASEAAAGFDLVAALDEDVILAPMQRALVPTGFAIALPEGHEAQIRPRSGLAAKHGITVLNSPGTIDADYRGEIKIILINLGSDPFRIARGDRIAQMLISRLTPAFFDETAGLDASRRGSGGFGSTGI